MKIQKTDGLYRKPRIRATAKVPLLLWLPIVLIIAAILVSVSLKTYILQQRSVSEITSVRKHSYRVVAVGNIACSPSDINFNEGEGVANGCQQQLSGHAVGGENADAIFLLGNIQAGGSFEEFERSFVSYWRNVNSAIYAIPGTSEYQASNTEGYEKAFATFFPGSTYRGEGGANYRFGMGQWDIFALDSNCISGEKCGFDSVPYNWLTRQVTQNVSGCSIAMWHHPSVSSSGALSRSSASDLFRLSKESGFDIILNAHDYHYERILDSSIRQFIVGTGGMGTKKVSEIAEGSEKVIEDQFGYLYLELYPGRYEWQFKNVQGDVLDSGGANCSTKM